MGEYGDMGEIDFLKWHVRKSNLIGELELGGEREEARDLAVSSTRQLSGKSRWPGHQCQIILRLGKMFEIRRSLDRVFRIRSTLAVGSEEPWMVLIA